MTTTTGQRAAPEVGTPLTPSRTTPGRPGRRRGDDLAAWLFLAPYLVLFGVFVILPILLGLWISLHSWDFTLPGKPWVGLQNYRDLFTPGSVSFDPFWNSMQATGIFTVCSVPLLIVVPLVVALVMNQKFPGRNLFRAIYFAPYVLGVAVVGVLWRYLLDANIGAVNAYLGKLGLPDHITWLSSVPEAWIALVFVTVWWTLGFNAVIYLAGLQDIPKELYEAAKVDGAGGVRTFFAITIPLLREMTTLVTILTLSGAFLVFNEVMVMTGGGPSNSSQVLGTWLYQNAFLQDDMGYAAAIATVIFVITFAISAAQIVYTRRRRVQW